MKTINKTLIEGKFFFVVKGKQGKVKVQDNLSEVVITVPNLHKFEKNQIIIKIQIFKINRFKKNLAAIKMG